MLPCHQYQRLKTTQHEELGLRPVLNGACKENCAKLAMREGDVNLDINAWDPQERFSLYDIPNFVCGSLLEIPFEAKHFGIAVLGEILEHCPWDSAMKIMQETRRVLKDDGRVIVSVPLDSRPPEGQHEQMITWEGGITNYHQTVWSPPEWNLLLSQTELVEIPEHRQEINYGFCEGFGAVLRKAGCV